MIRYAQENDLPLMQDIERAAGRMFAAIGMHRVADDPPLALSVLREHARRHEAWVWCDANDLPVAYALAVPLDGAMHIEQVSVDPAQSGRGIGRRLIDHIGMTARRQGIRALTLTTFTNVPWNGPYYERLGFASIPQSALSPGLAEIRRIETARGLDQWPRTCMRRDLDI